MPCTPEQLEASRKYRVENREKTRASVKKWRVSNREKALAATRRWAQENPDKVKAATVAYRAAHPGCSSRWAREWRRANPEYFLRKYGLALGDFIKFAVAQNARCAICGQQKKLCVDHSHATGKVRGLLCRQCNSAIGLFGDSESRVTREQQII